MSRNIIEVSNSKQLESLETAQPQSPDNYASQIVKLIPVEIVGVYLALQNLFAEDDGFTKFCIQSTLFLIILIITPFYLKLVGGITNAKQRLIATLSLLIWGISLGGPFPYFVKEVLELEIDAQKIGAAILMIYTLIVPMIYKVSTAQPSQT